MNTDYIVYILGFSMLALAGVGVFLLRHDSKLSRQLHEADMSALLDIMDREENEAIKEAKAAANDAIIESDKSPKIWKPKPVILEEDWTGDSEARRIRAIQNYMKTQSPLTRVAMQSRLRRRMRYYIFASTFASIYSIIPILEKFDRSKDKEKTEAKIID